MASYPADAFKHVQNQQFSCIWASCDGQMNERRSKQIHVQQFPFQPKTHSTITSLWGKIIIHQCANGAILFVWQQSINYKSCVTIQKNQAELWLLPQNKHLSKQMAVGFLRFMKEKGNDPRIKWKFKKWESRQRAVCPSWQSQFGCFVLLFQK